MRRRPCVFVSHGSAGMFCYDFAGKELWRKDLGKQIHIWGNASSPILYGDLAILWGGPGERQFLIAVSKKDGSTVWQHDEPGGRGDQGRPYVGSWSTPIVVKAGDHDELLLGVPENLKGFDPKTGKELWACAGLHNGDKDQLVYTSPVYADGIAVAFAGFGGAALAARVGGKGDVTETNRLWYQPSGPQRIGSPVLLGEHVYLVNENGTAECLELKTGKDLWGKKVVCGTVWGSLVAAGGRLYITDKSGDTAVLAASPKFEELAKNSLGETSMSTPAVADREIFLRTHKHLWCIAEKK